MYVWSHGIVVFVVLFAVNAVTGNLLYQNRRVAAVYESFAGHEAVKDWRSFGSVSAYVAWNMAIGVALCVIYVALFSGTLRLFPPTAAGVVFIVVVCVLKPLPEAANQYFNTTYPPRLIRIQLVNSIAGIVASGLVMAVAVRWLPLWQ